MYRSGEYTMRMTITDEGCMGGGWVKPDWASMYMLNSTAVWWYLSNEGVPSHWFPVEADLRKLSEAYPDLKFIMTAMQHEYALPDVIEVWYALDGVVVYEKIHIDGRKCPAWF